MRITSVYLAFAAAAIGTARAQSPMVLHAAPSGRATTEIRLTYPAPVVGARTDSVATAPAPPESQAKPFVISLEYGQPHLRGRTLHTDSLVPYDKPWRTGANGPTTLSTDVDVVLGGTPLPKGKYVLYTLPGRASWKLIVQKSVGQSGMTFDTANDLARVDLRRTPLAAPMESLTMWLIPSMEPGPAHGELRIAWGTDQLSTSWSVKGPP